MLESVRAAIAYMREKQLLQKLGVLLSISIILVAGYILLGVSPETASEWVLIRVFAGFALLLVGFAIADHMRTSLVQDALLMAKGQRGSLKGAVFH